MSEDKRIEFGKLVRDLRSGLKPKLSLRELARRCHISAPYLSNIERGFCHPPSAEVVKALAKELDVDPSVLLKKADRYDPDLAVAQPAFPPALMAVFKLIDISIAKGMDENESLSLRNMFALLLAENDEKDTSEVSDLETLAFATTAYAQLRLQKSNPSQEIQQKLERGNRILRSIIPEWFTPSDEGALRVELQQLVDEHKTKKHLTESTEEK